MLRSASPFEPGAADGPPRRPPCSGHQQSCWIAPEDEPLRCCSPVGPRLDLFGESATDSSWRRMTSCHAYRGVTQMKTLGQTGSDSLNSRQVLMEQMVRVIRSAQDDIENFRRTASSRSNCEIEWERAVEEWMRRRFPEWKDRQWRIAVAQALRMDEFVTRPDFDGKIRTSVAALSAGERRARPNCSSDRKEKQ
jgi:hypothetical protein